MYKRQDVNHQLFSDSVWGECRLAMEGLSDQRIQEVLDRLNLLAFREKHPMALSGGQKLCWFSPIWQPLVSNLFGWK